MKKLLLSLSALTLCFISGMAQHIPNSSFESWGTFSYEEPSTAWITSNALTVPEAKTVTVTRAGGYNSNTAVRLEVKTDGSDVIPAFMGNEVEGIFDSTGGRPYTGATPTGISGFIRYDLLNNDTAFLMVIFKKKDGTVVGAELLNIAQSGSQSSFTQFNIPVNVSATPDTVLLLCMINDLPSGNTLPTPGSWLELDSLTFETASGPIPAEEGGFENWSSFYIDEPTDWINGWRYMWGYPGQVTQTQDYHTGAYAASITTIEIPVYSEVEPGILGVIVEANLPAADSTDSLSFYYKYNTPAPGADLAFVSIVGLDADSNSMGQGEMMPLDTASSYTKVTMSFDNLPAGISYLYVSFYSSVPFGTETVGSNLIVDDVSIARTALGIKDVKKAALKIYPNPAKEVVYIEQSNGFDYRVVDMAGKTLLHGTIEGGQINIKQLIPGNYLLQIQDKNGDSQTSLIEKQ